MHESVPPDNEMMDWVEPARAAVEFAVPEPPAGLRGITMRSVLGDLPMYDVAVPDFIVGAEVDRILRDQPDLPGVLVTHGGAYLGLVSRRQLHAALSMEYGVALYGGRPIGALLNRFRGENRLIMPSTMGIGAAAAAALGRSSDQRYDPVAVRWSTETVRLLDAYILLLGVNASLESTQHEQLELMDELRRARSEAERATEAKSQFLARMSHELRTPLNAVLGFSDLILSETFGALKPLRYADSISAIHSAAGHLLSLISDVLDISKIEAGEMDLYVTTFSVEDLIHDVARFAEPLASRNGNTFACVVSRGVGRMRSDEQKIRQCLFNLLGNAGKFTAGGKIALTVDTSDGSGVRFMVADTGIGMTSKQTDQVLEPFVQANNEIASKYGGTGLGLSICKHFVELMGGTLGVSSAPGEGSRFWFILPREIPARDDG